jgi:hypothetical protein
MATIQGDYWQFYLEGRCEKRRLKNDIDEDALVEEMVRKGTPLRDAVLSACLRAAAPLEAGKARRAWVSEHEDEIRAAGGDSNAAYAAYLQGRTDDLAYVVEEGVVDALDQRFGDNDDDDEEADDEDEEGDE